MGTNNILEETVCLFIQNPVRFRDTALKSPKCQLFYCSSSSVPSPQLSFALVFGHPFGLREDKF